MESRLRFQGDYEAAMRDLVMAKGKAFIKYDEAAKVKEAKVDTKAIAANREFLKAELKLDNKLLFKRSQIESAVETWSLAFNKTEGNAKLDDKLLLEWRLVMTNRIMNINHVASHALQRGDKAPEWARDLQTPGEGQQQTETD